jgi:hypothetical protein
MRKFGTLGLFKIEHDAGTQPIIVGKATKDGLACGAKGVGEICSIPTAPGVQNAYYNRDGIFRTRLPLENTPLQQKVNSPFGAARFVIETRRGRTIRSVDSSIRNGGVPAVCLFAANGSDFTARCFWSARRHSIRPAHMLY